MAQMKDLKDLLKHEIQDLYSAEEQIIAAMPKMIGKATHPELKKALEQHLQVTEKQLERLDQVKKAFGEEGKKKGGLFGLFGGEQKCKGMEGLVTEGEKVMGENMTPEVMDAAIIACAQKIEHYEICGYGTARAYARELEMFDVAELLEQTLDEEYEADDLLTDLAVGSVNEEAEEGEEYEMEEESNVVMASNNRSGGRAAGSEEESNGRGNSARANAGKTPAKTSSARGTSGTTRSASGSKSGGAGNGRSGSTKTASSRGNSNSGRGGTSSGGGRSQGRSTAAKKGGAAKKSSKGGR
jgi:ferritin-like metal-binding protein YciE